MVINKILKSLVLLLYINFFTSFSSNVNITSLIEDIEKLKNKKLEKEQVIDIITNQPELIPCISKENFIPLFKTEASQEELFKRCNHCIINFKYLTQDHIEAINIFPISLINLSSYNIKYINNKKLKPLLDSKQKQDQMAYSNVNLKPYHYNIGGLTLYQIQNSYDDDENIPIYSYEFLQRLNQDLIPNLLPKNLAPLFENTEALFNEVEKSNILSTPLDNLTIEQLKKIAELLNPDKNFITNDTVFNKIKHYDSIYARINAKITKKIKELREEFKLKEENIKLADELKNLKASNAGSDALKNEINTLKTNDVLNDQIINTLKTDNTKLQQDKVTLEKEIQNLKAGNSGPDALKNEKDLLSAENIKLKERVTSLEAVVEDIEKAKGIHEDLSSALKNEKDTLESGNTVIRKKLSDSKILQDILAAENLKLKEDLKKINEEQGSKTDIEDQKNKDIKQEPKDNDLTKLATNTDKINPLLNRWTIGIGGASLLTISALLLKLNQKNNLLKKQSGFIKGY